MRTHQHRAVAGNCGCCLVPFAILLIIFIAVVVVTSLLCHKAAPDIFRWGPARHYHFDPYRDGFHEGNRMGVEYTARGQPEPGREALDDLARRKAEQLNIRRDRRRWMEGFRDGFKQGFENANKQASSSGACARLC